MFSFKTMYQYLNIWLKALLTQIAKRQYIINLSYLAMQIVLGLLKLLSTEETVPPENFDSKIGE